MDTHTHTRLTALFLGLPVWAGTEKVKPIWILLKQETVSGSGISWDICKSAPRSRQITTPAPHHSVFTGRMPFLLPNQIHQSTEGSTIRMESSSIKWLDKLCYITCRWDGVRFKYVWVWWMSCCVDYVKLPREVLVASLGPLVKLLQAPSPVVHSYAALCLERILTVKSPSAGGVLAYVIGFLSCNIFLVFLSSLWIVLLCCHCCVSAFRSSLFCSWFSSNSVFCIFIFINYVPSVLWRCCLGVRKSIRPVKIEWWGASVVICLERGADRLHVVPLMLPPSQNPIISCLI